MATLTSSVPCLGMNGCALIVCCAHAKTVACPPRDALCRRLPAEAGQHYGVQFSTGLMMWKGSLYISYGITDCFAAVAEVPNGEAQVQRWIQQGMGTQNWRGQG